MNYFIGNDPKKWHANIPTYAGVEYKNVYPGVDLIYYSNESGQLEFDFRVAPGTDPNIIKFTVEEVSTSAASKPRLERNSRGELSLRAGSGKILFRSPVLYQQRAGGMKRYVAGSFVEKRNSANGSSELTFEVGQYDHSRPLIIDPAITYSTYVGGTIDTAGSGIATHTDPISGHLYAYVTGTTCTSDDPWQLGASCDVLVTKFDPSASGTASIIYSTTFGGNSGELAGGIAVDAAGDAYITGTTESGDFPLLNAFEGIRGSAFLTELNPYGSGLLYSTKFGGTAAGEYAYAVALDSAGHAYIAGQTASNDLPLANPFQTTFSNQGGSAFLAGFDTTQSGSASLIYSTYLPVGSANAIAVDAQGCIHIGGSGGFYAKLNPKPAGTAQLAYSTYLGDVTVQGVAVDSAGNAYLTGNGDSTLPITSGAFATTGGAFVAKINPSLSGAASLIYSTFVGPGIANGIAVDSSGDAFVTGSAGPGMQLVNPVQSAGGGIFQSLDGGQTWTTLNRGINDFQITSLAIDTSTSPRTLYAGTLNGHVFASTDGGLNWAVVLQTTDPHYDPSGYCGGPEFFTGSGSEGCVLSLAIDPTTPSHVFAGTNGGVYQSLDRGSTWALLNSGLSSVAVGGIPALVFDGGTLYAGAGDGIYALAPGATSWTHMTLNQDVGSIVIDTTTTPHTFYTGSYLAWFGYTSSDGGNTWTLSGGPQNVEFGFFAVSIDRGTSPPTIWDWAYGQLWKTSDRGQTWTILNDPSEDLPGTTMVFDDSTNPATVYIAEDIVSKSVDGGNNWTYLARSMEAIALDPTVATSNTPAALYIASDAPAGPNAFVAELNPSGTGLLFSTYLGSSITQSFGNAIALDNSESIYLTGRVTGNGGFPTVNAFQTSDSVGTLGFFAVLGTQTLPSSGSTTTQVGVQTGTLSISFSNITGSIIGGAPTLTVTPLSSTTTANFQLSGNLGAYDISTTATYTGNITLCFQAQTVNDQFTFNNLAILHVINGTPVNVTTSWNFPTRTVCGTVTSLSPFVLVKGVLNQINDLLRNVNEVNLRHGIQASLDAKLQNAESAFSSATGHNYNNVCNMMGAFMNSVQAQSGNAITTTEASNMIAAAKQIQSTLVCAP